jgi:hypothetical protein
MEAPGVSRPRGHRFEACGTDQVRCTPQEQLQTRTPQEQLQADLVLVGGVTDHVWKIDEIAASRGAGAE